MNIKSFSENNYCVNAEQLSSYRTPLNCEYYLVPTFFIIKKKIKEKEKPESFLHAFCLIKQWEFCLCFFFVEKRLA